MGGEFGQFIEWKFDDRLDWFLLEYEMHQKMKDYVKELNHFYLQNPSFWEDDNDWSGFQWISPDDCNQSVLAFIRKSRTSGEYILAIMNFTPVNRQNYRIGVPKANSYQEVFNSDDHRYGGSGIVSKDAILVEDLPCHNFEQSIELSIPPLSTVYYKPLISARDII
jgi:1,4-alpha-glucan branching enzyme